MCRLVWQNNLSKITIISNQKSIHTFFRPDLHILSLKLLGFKLKKRTLAKARMEKIAKLLIFNSFSFYLRIKERTFAPLKNIS